MSRAGSNSSSCSATCWTMSTITTRQQEFWAGSSAPSGCIRSSPCGWPAISPALHEYNKSLWDSTADPVGTLTEEVAARYREVLRAVGPDALLTLGNVDVAAALERGGR